MELHRYIITDEVADINSTFCLVRMYNGEDAFTKC